MSDCSDVILVDGPVTLVVTPGDVKTTLVDVSDATVLVQSTADATLVDSPSILILQSDGGSGPAGATGPAGPAGGVVTALAAENITAFKVVAMDSGGQFYLADPSILSDSCYVVGISLFSALAGESLQAQTDGVIVTGALWSPGPLFLGPGGTLVTSSPLAGFALAIATAATTTQLIVRPQFAIDLA